MEFFNPHLYDLSNPELWVAVGLILFLAIVVVSGALKMVGGALDAKAAKIQSELDEAARLRAEAQASAEVKAAAVELAAQAAEQILAARQASAKDDPMIDAAIAQIGQRLN